MENIHLLSNTTPRHTQKVVVLCQNSQFFTHDVVQVLHKPQLLLLLLVLHDAQAGAMSHDGAGQFRAPERVPQSEEKGNRLTLLPPHVTSTMEMTMTMTTEMNCHLLPIQIQKW
jgi:hypothetical protein